MSEPSPRRGRSTRAAASSEAESPEEPETKEKKKAGTAKKAVRKTKQPKEPAAKKKSTKKATPKKKTGPRGAAKKTDDDPPAAKKKAKRKASDDDSDSSASTKKPKAKRAKAPPHQRITERDEIPKLWKGNEDSYTFKIASWNVAGLRALVRNHPTALADLVSKHDLDALCLQETKLQESHLTDPKLKLNGGDLLEGYDAHWSCSEERKGYSGTAVFIRQHGTTKKKKQTNMKDFFGSKSTTATDSTGPTSVNMELDDEMIKNLIPTEVSFGLGKDHEAANEGRVINVDLPLFSFTNVYVPNSGQKLDRLKYRTEEWDKHLLQTMQAKQEERGVPVLWLGDLNVAHTNLEVWNDGAKHLPKQAGITPEERASFQEQLDAGFIDAFRKLHPEAKGHYTYWSQRAGNREPNKGLRLDYFVCSPALFDDKNKVVVRDSYMLPEQIGSDHCPVVLELEIKK